MGDPIALPPGARLVHIGPHKTGTTAIQRALHRSREELHAQGVHYAYPTVQAYRPAISLTGLRGRRGGPTATPADWEDLVAEVRDAGDMQVVISSESLSNADRSQIERLRDDLGPDRVQVVRMVRRYDRLVPSQWQQAIHNGRRMSFDRFCDELLDPESRFWRRHGFADLTRRWAEVVGTDRVTVVVVDDQDPHWLLHVFEQMLSLRDGTLPLSKGANRSLSMAEAETLRRVNGGIAEHHWGDRAIHHYVREGASVGFKLLAPDAAAGRPRLSREVHEHLQEMTRRHVADLRALGVRIVGDVDLLAVPPWEPPAEGENSTPITLSAASVASATLGIVRKAEHPVPLEGDVPDLSAPPAPPGGSRRPLLARRRALHLTPPGPAGEFARRAAAARLVEPGTGRAGRALVTVVPPWQVLAGRWQEHLTARGETEYAAWLAEHDEAWDLPDLLAEAVDRVDPKRVVVAVADARFPGSWAGAVGDLLGSTAVDPAAGRSLLTWAEAEWVREFNAQSRRLDLADERWRRHLLHGALPWTLAQQPDRGAGAHPLDGDLLTRAEQLGEALRTAIERSGAQVLGDLDRLTELRPGPARARLRPRAASWPILGAIASSAVDSPTA